MDLTQGTEMAGRVVVNRTGTGLYNMVDVESDKETN